MDSMYEILMESGKILMTFMIVVSIFVSALILFAPKKAMSINTGFGKTFQTDTVSDSVDKHYDTTEAIINRRWWIGGFFLAGAIFTLKYLLLDFKAKIFIDVIVDPNTGSGVMFTEMAVDFFRWFFIVTAGMGVVTCLAILFNPNLFRRISSGLDKSYSTKSVQDRLDKSNHGLDEWVIRNHIFVGLFLLSGSIFVFIFCLNTFYMK